MRKVTVTSSKKAEAISKKRTAIGSRLRRGDMTQIAALTGYDVSHVCRVIRGTRNNPEIVNAAYSHVGKRKAKA
jgi:hypothetical protein